MDFPSLLENAHEFLPILGLWLTRALAALSVILLSAIALHLTRSRLFAALTALPLALNLPWAKPFPAAADAATLFFSLCTLALWLYVQRDFPARAPRALKTLALILFLKPDLILFVLLCLAAESLRRAGGVTLKRFVLALLLLSASTSLSAVIFNPIPPLDALLSVVQTIRLGAIWDSSHWTLAGASITSSLRSASTHGATFYAPLLIPFLALSLPYRREPWFAPLFAWTAIILALTLHGVHNPILRALPTLQAAFLASLGSTAALSLRVPPVESPSPPRRD